MKKDAAFRITHFTSRVFPEYDVYGNPGKIKALSHGVQNVALEIPVLFIASADEKFENGRCGRFLVAVLDVRPPEREPPNERVEFARSDALMIIIIHIQDFFQ